MSYYNDLLQCGYDVLEKSVVVLHKLINCVMVLPTGSLLTAALTAYMQLH